MKLKISYIISFLFSVTILFAQKAPHKSLYEDGKPNDSLLKNILQRAYAVHKEDPALAQKLLDSAEVICEDAGHEFMKPQIAEQKGQLFLSVGCYPAAISELQKSYRLYQQIPDLYFRTGYIEIEFGNIFYDLRQYNEAIKFYNKALPIFEDASLYHRKYGKGVVYNKIGTCYLKQKKYDEALQSFKQALNLRKKMDAPGILARSYVHLADVFIAQRDFESADSIISRGLAIEGLSLGGKRYSQLMIQKGLITSLLGNLSEGRKILERTHQQIKDSEQEDLYIDINHALCKLEMLAGDYLATLEAIDDGYQFANEGDNYLEAINFAEKGKQVASNQGNTVLALGYTEKLSAQKDAFISINNQVLKELLSLGSEIEAAQKENNFLQDTADVYSSIISNQKGLLASSIILIILLILVAVVFINTNKKLKKNQENQREMNLRILAVINRTESLILSLGANGEIRVINKPAIRFFLKWVNTELKAGDNLLERLHNTPAYEVWKQAIQKSKTIFHWKEVSQFVVNNKALYFLENFSTIHGKNGNYSGLVIVSNDITKEHEFNVKMTEQNNTLAKSNKAKERMLSILAHDLKDAVYSAHSLSELVLETPEEFPKEELIHLFSLLHGNFDKTKSLLNGLLDWMKAQTGAMEMKCESIKLFKVVDDVFEACYGKSVSKGISLKADIDKQITVLADGEMIKTVLRNLVSNSLKYTEPHKGVIEVTASENKGKITIHVKDNGQGISKKNLQKLFQGPGQFTTAGTLKEQGTGFGLSLCKELIQLHNSKLEVSSKEGVGSDFFFSLPIGNGVKDTPKKVVL